jgi:hypothetical protein
MYLPHTYVTGKQEKDTTTYVGIHVHSLNIFLIFSCFCRKCFFKVHKPNSSIETKVVYKCLTNFLATWSASIYTAKAQLELEPFQYFCSKSKRVKVY